MASVRSRSVRSGLIGITLILELAGMIAAQDQGRVVSRPVTVADTITMNKLGDPMYWYGGSSKGVVAEFSPDSEKFVVVLRKGNIETNTNEFTMLLWRTKDVFTTSIPEALLTMSSSSNRAALRNVNWQANNETVEFVGENPGQASQIYTLDVGTRAIKQLSSRPENVVDFSMSADGRKLAYLVEAPARSLIDDKSRRKGIVVSAQPVDRLIAGRYDDGAEWQLFYQEDSRPAQQLIAEHRITKSPSVLPYLSPDGKYIVVLMTADEVQSKWKQYTDPLVQRKLTAFKSAGQQSNIELYALINTMTGEARPLLDVPQSIVSRGVLWLPDSHSVIIANTYLPPESVGQDGAQKKYTVEVDIPSGKTTIIGDGDLVPIRFDAKGSELVCDSEGAGNADNDEEIYFARTKMGWKRLATSIASTNRLEITLEEDMHTAPRIFAIDKASHKKTLLLDLNPQFSKLKFGRVEEISWRPMDDVEVKGGLYYPIDYVAGKKYPLVIQTHAWSPDKFYIDGPWTTAFAAQPLAGKGIMVLQAERWNVPKQWWHGVWDTRKELDAELSVYERAIDYLDDRGLIDRDRIGIIGFSRTCLYVKVALTSSKYHFAAASVTDGEDDGYLQYLSWVNFDPLLPSEFETYNGGPPFGEGLRSWLDRSPGFNIDKVHTPLRITALGPASVLGEWEWYAALSRLHRPVDMVVLEDAKHVLQKPWERLASQQEGTVDWFSFWLKGEEDPDPAKAEQYARWRNLRTLQARASLGTTKEGGEEHANRVSLSQAFSAREGTR